VVEDHLLHRLVFEERVPEEANLLLGLEDVPRGLQVGGPAEGVAVLVVEVDEGLLRWDHDVLHVVAAAEALPDALEAVIVLVAQQVAGGGGRKASFA
jgi:hypothetical protein